MNIAESKLQFKMPAGLRLTALILMGVGLLTLALQVVFPWHSHGADGVSHSRLYMSSYLAILFGIFLVAGAIFLAAIAHVGGAAWVVTIRRLIENYVWFLPVLILLLALLFAFGFDDLFSHWTRAKPDDHLINHKKAWLDKEFFIGRNLAALVLWVVFGFIFYRMSVAQDEHGDVSTTRKLARISAGFLVVFALTYCMSSWDLTMSLEPHWFSTMWAVYMFAGTGLSVYASVILWIWYLKKQGYYGETLNENHLHDVGKYLWGHTIFWGYIAVSQFLLIWYSHIPEETIFYSIRGGYKWESGWAYVSFLLPILRFVLPFFLIIKRESKRNFNYMAGIAVLILVGQVVDLYWIAYPTLDHGHFVMFSWQEAGALAFVIGAFLLVMGYALGRSTLIPKKDPRLEECLHFHQ